MNEKKFLKIIEQQSNIIIYGAGMVGELLYKRLLMIGLEEKVCGFAVTKRSQSVEKFCGQPVFEIAEVANKKRESLVVIATLKGLHQEMEKVLKTLNFENIIKISDGLYRSISLNYIRDFRKKQKMNKKEFDVLFMASDNNSSSGAFLCMVDLNCELMKQNISTLVVLPEYGTGEKILNEKRIPYTYIVSYDWAIDDKFSLNVYKRFLLFKNLRAIKELQELVQRYNVKLIHNNTTYTYIGAYVARSEQVALVWHIRECMKFQNKQFLNRRWAVKTMSCSDKIIFISQYMKDCLKELDDENGVIVYDGLDTDMFFVQNHKILEQKEVVITLVGALVEHKRQEELICAVATLKQRGYKAYRVRLVGSGKPQYERHLQDLVSELDVSDSIEFWGRRDDMRSIYSETDIVVVCSGIEGFGRVTVEGQLAGCLVIAANSGATVELIEDGSTGMLYEAGNSESLANCIEKALRCPDKVQEIAANGQLYACQNYSREKNATEIVGVYKEIWSK